MFQKVQNLIGVKLVISIILIGPLFTPLKAAAHDIPLNSPERLIKDYLPWVSHELAETVSTAIEFIDLYWEGKGYLPEKFRHHYQSDTLQHDFPRIAQLKNVDFNEWVD